jgi:hypothetical protein
MPTSHGCCDFLAFPVFAVALGAAAAEASANERSLALTAVDEEAVAAHWKAVGCGRGITAVQAAVSMNEPGIVSFDAQLMAKSRIGTDTFTGSKCAVAQQTMVKVGRIGIDAQDVTLDCLAQRHCPNLPNAVTSIRCSDLVAPTVALRSRLRSTLMRADVQQAKHIAIPICCIIFF